MLDFSKLYCHYHTQQLITNFCSKQQCQMGLCASCICVHTQQHMQKGSMPEYENIRTTYKNINDGLTNQAQELQCLKLRINQVQQKAEQKRSKLKQIIKIARQQVINAIESLFDRKEEELLRFMEAEDKKHGLHSELRFDSLKNNIEKEISNLAYSIEQIDAYNFMECLPKIRMQTMHNARNFIYQVSEEVKNNQCYSTSISYNKNILNEIQHILSRSVVVNIGRDPTQINNNLTLPFPLKKITNIKAEQAQPVKPEKQAPALFTLRRPSSQESLSTVGYNQRKEQSFNNVFNYPENTFEKQKTQHSRATVNKISCHQPRQSYQDFLRQNGSKFAVAREPKEIEASLQRRSSKQNRNLLLQSDIPNFEYTFGSQVKEYNPLSYPKQSTPQSIYEKNSQSRISDKVYGLSNEKYNPCFVSDYQGKQINNNIKKMQIKSSLQRKSKKSGIQLLNSSESQFDISREMSENQKPYMYRTQFL